MLRSSALANGMSSATCARWVGTCSSRAEESPPLFAVRAINHTNLSTPQSLGAIVVTAIHHACNHPTSFPRIHVFMVSLTAISGPVLQFPFRCSRVSLQPRLSAFHTLLSGTFQDEAFVSTDALRLHAITTARSYNSRRVHCPLLGCDDV